MLKKLAVFVAIFILTDFLVANFARSAGLLPDAEFVERSERKYRTTHPVYHHGLKANVVADSYWGGYQFEIKTNSLGFKDSEDRTVSLATDKSRVLFIGDSFTEGVGFPYPKTFVGIIAEELEGRGYEVLNAGVASYSASIYYAKINYLLSEVGLRIQEVVVFIDISDIRDDAFFYRLDGDRVVDADPGVAGGAAHFAEEVDPYAEIKALIKENSIVARVIDLAKDSLKDDRWINASYDDPWFLAAVNDHASRWTFEDASFEAFGKRGLKNASDAMNQLADLLQRKSIPLTVVVYPWPAQIVKPQGNNRQRKFWREFASSKNVGFIDLFPSFLDGRESREILDDYYIFNDVHWNAKGHEFVAGKFLQTYSPIQNTSAE